MPEAQRSAVLFARVALGAGLVATALGAWQVRQDIERDATAQFGFAADQVTLRIAERLRAYEMILRGGAGLFAASGRVDRGEWRQFVDEFQAGELVPGVQGIGFALNIAPGELAAHEAGVRAEGFPDYAVHPAGQRAAYTAIVYLEPFRDRNLRAFGYDMFSEPVRRQAMERARDTGEATLSGKVVLVQESGSEVQAGTLMYVPVYDRHRPATTAAERRNALLGWVYSPYRMNDLMAGVLQDWQTAEGRYLHLRIYDGESHDPGLLLYDSANAAGGGAPGAATPLAARRTLDFHGRPWLLEFNRSSTAPGLGYLPVWLTAGGGVLLSGLLFGLLMSLARTRERGVQLAHTLTDAIRRRERQLEESEFRWRFALEGSRDGLWDWNLADDTVWYSPRYKEMLGFAPDEMGNGLAEWSDRVHPDDRERTLAAVNDYLQGKTAGYACEHRLRCKDGHYIWVLDRGLVVDRGETGTPLRMIGTHADITADKELKDSLRRSRAELEEAQRIAEFASWTLDKASGRVTWTPQLFRMLRLPPNPDGTAPGFDRQREVFGAASYEKLQAAVMRVLEGGTPYELELEMLRADGSRGWMQARGEPVHAADGSITGIHGVAADITERKQARLRIEQLNRLYAALSECNWAIVHCASETELLERVCDVLVRHGGIDTAWIGLIDPATGAVSTLYARGEGSDAVRAVPVSVDPGEPAGRGPVGMAARESRPVWIQDLQDNPLAGDWQALARRLGWRASACLPLLRGRTPFAVLTLFSTEAGWGDADTRQLVEQIGSNMNFAVEKLGIESEARAFRQQQADAQERFRALVERSRVGAFILQEGVIRYANLRAGEILGLPGPDALIGRRLADIAEPAHRDGLGQALADLTGGRAKAVKAVIRAARPDGSRVEIGVNATLASEGAQAPVLVLLKTRPRAPRRWEVEAVLIHPSHRQEAAASLATLAVLLLGLAGISALPLVEPGTPLSFYLPAHNTLEMFAIAVAAMVFALGWSTQLLRPSRRMLWTGCLFLGVALFDLSHTLSLTGMPAFLGYNTHDKTLYFWLFARGLAAAALLVATLVPEDRGPSTPRAGALAIVLSGVALGHVLVLTRMDLLPELFTPGVGLTRTKLAVEYVVAGVALVAAVVLALELRRPRTRHTGGLLGAAGASAMSGWFFASYGSINDGYALAGHVFKVIAYLFLYRALFLEAVRSPYVELRNSRASLGATLDTLPDLLFEMDADGNYLDIHASGERELVAPAQHLAGKNLRDVMPQAAAEACLAAITEARRNGRSVGTRIELEVPSGRRRFELSVARKPVGDDGQFHYLMLSRDVTELVEKQAAIEHEARLNKALLELPGKSATLGEQAFLQHGAEAARRLTGSGLAFLHALGDDGETLALQAWTPAADGATAEGVGSHFPLHMAGNWADAARQQKPLVRNEGPHDEAGLPGGHPPLQRFLALPVPGGTKPRLLLLVANRDAPYGPGDIETLQLLGDSLWQITSRARHERLLQEKQDEMDYFFQSDLDLYSIVDAKGEFLRVNHAWEQLLGYPSERLAGRRLLDFVHPDDRDATAAALATLEGAGSRIEFANRYLSRDGTYRDIEWRARPRGRVVYMSARDVSDRRRQEATIRRLSSAVSQSPSAILITDIRGRIEYVNPAFTAISGYEAAEVLGKNPRFLQSGRTPPTTYQELWVHLLRGEPWHGEFINRRKDGTDYFEAAQVYPIRDVRGEVVGYMSHKEDVTARRAAAERIQELSYFDQLTGLPNRTQFERQFQSTLAAAEKAKGTAALLWLDLDNFKAVNDSLGHDLGDLLLREMANRLRTHLGEHDVASRQSGDDFTILMPGAGQDQAAALAGRLLQTLQAPISLGAEELIISGSIGIAMYPGDGANVAALGACAEAAMYRVKKEGRNGYRFFAPAMQEHTVRTLALTTALKHALARNELRLAYQPQYSLVTGELIGAEALLRWRSPQWGDVSPGEFVPLAEANGLIVGIGEWVLRTAAAQLRQWQESGLGGLTVAVNLTATQFAQPGLLEMVRGIAAEAGVETRWLELELTEAVALRDPEGARATMEALHEAGFRLSIDDFGTGYSSMSYLKRFPVDKLKIDQSFVRELATRDDDLAIVGAIVQMAHNLGMGTIAEGVETAEQLTLLRARGCDEIQGYFYSRPLEADAFAQFAAARRQPHPPTPP